MVGAGWGRAGQGRAKAMSCCGGSDVDDWYADEVQGKKREGELPPGRAARRKSFGAVRDMLGGVPGAGSSKHLKEAYRKFCQADRDGSGSIDAGEFQAAFNLPDTPYLQRLWSFFDMDGSGASGSGSSCTGCRASRVTARAAPTPLPSTYLTQTEVGPSPGENSCGLLAAPCRLSTRETTTPGGQTAWGART